MRQYEIRWAELAAPAGRRPVLLLSRTPAYAYLDYVLGVEVTTRIRGIPQELALGPREGLAYRSVASFDKVHLVTKTKIGELIGVLPASRHHEAKRALGHALDWPELKMIQS